MSMVTYNGITLPYPYMTNFTQTPVYDEMGSTDWYCTKFDIQIQTVINSAYLNMLAPELFVVNTMTPSTKNPANILNVVRSKLMLPRKSLTYTVNGVDMIPKLPNNIGLVDVQNGPKPQSCQILRLTNTTFLLSYHIVCWYWEKNTISREAGDGVSTENTIGNNTLSNRWSESMNVNGLNLSTRVREGRFVIRSDNKDKFIAAQIIPQMAAIGVAPLFLRESAQYTVSPDGLSINYRITDVEQFKMPPNPAFRSDGVYSEKAGKADAIRTITAHVRLEGGGFTDQAELLRTCLGVCASKLNINGAVLFPRPGEGKAAVLVDAQFQVGMYSNWVEASLSALADRPRARVAGVNSPEGNISFTPGTDGAVALVNGELYRPAYKTFGNSGRLVQAAAYYDPSILNTIVNKKTGQLTNGVEVGRGG